MQRLEECITRQDLYNVYLIVCGDLNARKANVDDFVTIDQNIPELLEFTELLDGVIDIQRSSCCMY